MPRFVVGDDRSQSTLFPERLEDYLSEDNPVRAIEVFAMSLIWPGAVQATLDRIPAENAPSPPDRSGIHSARKIVDSDALPDERAAR